MADICDRNWRLVLWRLLVVFVSIAQCATLLAAPSSQIRPRSSRDALVSPPIDVAGETSYGRGLLAGHFQRLLAQEALIIAARDGLGLDVRDRTLDEVEREDDAVTYRLVVTARLAGNVEMELIGPAEQQVWHRQIPIKVGATVTLPSLIPQLEALSRDEMVAVWKSLGVDGLPLRKAAADAISPELEAQLQRLDVVSQVMAVRNAHRQLRRSGESPRVIGALCRAYAHLSLLTRHHWSLNSEVFGARSLLYAERLVATAPDERFARWHRAYAGALVGTHFIALNDLAWLAEHRDGATDRDGGEVPGSWCRIAEPVCRYDDAALVKLAAQHAECSELCHLLLFHIARTRGDPALLHQAAVDAAHRAPGGYGVYSVLIAEGGLGSSRWAASIGPVALLRNTTSVLESNATSLPETIRDVARQVTNDLGADDQIPFFSDRGGIPLAEIKRICDRLRGLPESEFGADTYCCEMARLLEEELFLMAHVVLRDSGNATSHDMTDDIRRVAPWAEGHRYAPYLQTFGLKSPNDTASMAQYLRGVKFGPVRQYMNSLWWYVANDVDLPNRETIVNSVGREFVAHSLESSYRHMRADRKAMIAREVREVSPYSPYALRYAISSAEDPDEGQLQRWESEANRDSRALYLLGRAHADADSDDDAIRCLQKSLNLIPNHDVADYLAKIFWRKQAFDQWEAALLQALTGEDVGLAHNVVHEKLAWGFTRRGQFDKAAIHARQAAEAYSQRGLYCAARCFELMREWDESGLWWSRLSQAYVSNRNDWYLFCLRSGVGDRDSARRVAHPLMSDHLAGEPAGTYIFYATIDMVADAPQRARRRLKAVREPTNDLWYEFHMALVAEELQDQALLAQAKETIVEQQKNAENESSQRALTPTIAKIVLEGVTEANDAELAKLWDQVATADSFEQVDLAYFVGAALENAGRREQAVAAWRKACSFPWEATRLNYVLAAARLRRLGIDITQDPAAAEPRGGDNPAATVRPAEPGAQRAD